MASKYEVVNYENLGYWCNDGAYLYGHDREYVYRRDLTTGVREQLFRFWSLPAPSGGFYSLSEMFCTRDSVLASAWDSNTRKFAFFRSVDKGVTWAEVFKFGDIDGTVANQISEVRTLSNKSFCVADVEGSSVLLVGEYNVHPGSGDLVWEDTDQVRILRSVDDGATWDVAVTWNAVSPNIQTRHVHAIVQDSFSRQIYIALGDSGSHAAMIVWDGITPLSNNSQADFALSGLQRYRCADFLFTRNHVFTIADASTSTPESGIWRWEKDLSSGIRVDDSILEHTDSAGFIGVTTDLGDLVFSTFVGAAATDTQIKFICSSDQGVTWSYVGLWGKQEGTTGGLTSMFKINDTVYISGQGSGKGVYLQTTELQNVGSWREDDTPVVFHPMFWVDPVNGANSSTEEHGWHQDDAWQTLEYAMEGDRICRGARVVLTDNITEAGRIAGDWDGHVIQGSGRTVIDHIGPCRAEIVMSTSEASGFLFAPEEPVSFHNVAISFTGAAADGIMLTGGDVILDDAAIGGSGAQTLTQGLIDVRGGGSYALMNMSSHSVPPGSLVKSIAFGSGGGNVRAQRSNFSGGVNPVETVINDSVIEIYNCNFTNYTGSGVYAAGSAPNVTPIIKNSIFDGVPFTVNGANLADPTDTEVDYNLYPSTVLNGGTHSISGVAGGNILNAGTIIPTVHFGFLVPPDIGSTQTSSKTVLIVSTEEFAPTGDNIKAGATLVILSAVDVDLSGLTTSDKIVVLLSGGIHSFVANGLDTEAVPNIIPIRSVVTDNPFGRRR